MSIYSLYMHVLYAKANQVKTHSLNNILYNFVKSASLYLSNAQFAIV